MGKITVIRKGKKVELDILFDIFDARNTSMLEENQVISRANNTRDALKKYLSINGQENINFVRGGCEDVTFCVSPFFVEENTRYRAGRRVWYKVR